MENYPLTTGNYILILIGVLLILSGPYIIYRTVTGVLKAKKANSSASMHIFSNGLNLVIAVLLFLAGILFVMNNLGGSSLSTV